MFAGLTQSPEDTSPAGVIGGVLAAVIVVAILAGVGFILLRYAGFTSLLNKNKRKTALFVFSDGTPSLNPFAVGMILTFAF